MHHRKGEDGHRRGQQAGRLRRDTPRSDSLLLQHSSGRGAGPELSLPDIDLTLAELHVLVLTSFIKLIKL